VYSGESQVNPDTMTEVETILKSKGICEESGGSWIIDLKTHARKLGTAIIRDRSGSSTYLLRDLAAVIDRSKTYSFDKMIYVVAADHGTHFARLFKILELMDMHELASKLHHAPFSEVSEMSKHLGHDHMLGEILDQYQNTMEESLKLNPEKSDLLGFNKEAAETIGITALLSQELSARRANNHAFDIKLSTSFEFGTGPELQFWYARLCSILNHSSGPANSTDIDFSALEEENQSNLLRILIQYPDVTHQAYKTLESAGIMTYLSSVTGQLAVFFEDNQSETVNPAQAMLLEATKIVMENGMKLLGITPVAKI